MNYEDREELFPSASRIPRKMVGVIGGARAEAGVLAMAEDVGRIIAECGHVLVCGGLGGVMEAAARGAVRAGGLTVGILPGLSRDTANPFISIPVVTAMSHARNAIIVRTADILIAIGGRYGTLSEIALAKAANKRVLGIYSWNDIPGVEEIEDTGDIRSSLSEL